MIIALKVLCGLFALLMASFGVRWWFSFSGIEAEWQVDALNGIGINNLTADMGALFFGTAILIVLGLRAGKSQWLLSAAVLMLVAAAGRILVYATLGYEGATLSALIVEVVAGGVLFFTHQKMSTSTNS